MDENHPSTGRIWILLAGTLVFLAVIVGAIIYAVFESTRRAQEALQPMTSLASNLSTQVAQALHPTPTILPDPITVVHEVRSLARLETIQYTVEKVITAETGQEMLGFLFGDRLLFIAHGIVIAGVDLEKLQPSDLELRDGTVYLHLPATEIFIVSLQNDQSYVYDRETGILTKGDIHLETAARRVAEDEIAKSALEDGILDLARRNAEAYLYRLFISLGFPGVIFIQPTPASP
jgi:hypothetical protein